MKKIHFLSISSVWFLAPLLVSAQTTATNILGVVTELLNQIIPLIITLAVIFFFWGLAKFILKAGDPEGRAEGRGIMIWGVIALFVMVSVWGLVAVLQETFGTLGTAETPGLSDTFFNLTP